MSTTLTVFLGKVNNYLGDNISGTTDDDGNAAKTTFVDSALSKYDDLYFGDPERNPEWWAYISSTLRSIKTSQSSGGVITVHKAFAAQVASATAYELHRFDRDNKIIACNQALDDAYPLYYNRHEDATTLDGKGGSDNEYEVPNTFTEFPSQIWQKHTSTSLITYTEITNYKAVEIGGTMKFYATIVENDDVVLVGKKYLTQFTNDASTTELTNAQAAVVALLATSIFYRTLSGIVNAADSSRFDSLAIRFEEMYEQKKYLHAMPFILSQEINHGWLDE